MAQPRSTRCHGTPTGSAGPRGSSFVTKFNLKHGVLRVSSSHLKTVRDELAWAYTPPVCACMRVRACACVCVWGIELGEEEGDREGEMYGIRTLDQAVSKV